MVYGGLRIFQSRHVFGPMNLQVRQYRFGYVVFLLRYQVRFIIAPALAQDRSFGVRQSATRSLPCTGGSGPRWRHGRGSSELVGIRCAG